VGTRQIRPYHFEADKLILSDSVNDDPEVVRWKIVWQKANRSNITFHRFTRG
jgi:hypothetical protein